MFKQAEWIESKTGHGHYICVRLLIIFPHHNWRKIWMCSHLEIGDRNITSKNPELIKTESFHTK